MTATQTSDIPLWDFGKNDSHVVYDPTLVRSPLYAPVKTIVPRTENQYKTEWRFWNTSEASCQTITSEMVPKRVDIVHLIPKKVKTQNFDQVKAQKKIRSIFHCIKVTLRKRRVHKHHEERHYTLLSKNDMYKQRLLVNGLKGSFVLKKDFNIMMKVLNPNH